MWHFLCGKGGESGRKTGFGYDGNKNSADCGSDMGDSSGIGGCCGVDAAQNIEDIKRQSGEDAIVFIAKWKQRKRMYRLRRAGVRVAVAVLCVAATGAGYYGLDRSIPSHIYVRAGEEQSLNLKIPAKAEIIGASTQGESNIPKGAVSIDLNRDVTLRMGGQEEYQMQVKLFGFLPFKEMYIRAVEDEELIPVGKPVGIYMKTRGILVIGTGEFMGADGATNAPSKYVLKSGDYIRKADGVEVAGKEALIRMVEESGGREIILTIEREGEEMEQRVVPAMDQSGAYKIGLWIRDNAQGVGTMTYMDGSGRFGALGHGINDLDTSALMDIEDGTLYRTEIVSIRKGEVGSPGEMTGRIIYTEEWVLGDIWGNSAKGIFGSCNQKGRRMAESAPMPIGFKQEIVRGPAQILCTIGEKTEYFDVEITAVHLDHDNVNRGIELRVTDEELLGITGGIVQGMSGSPIIQNGKFVGAVTHVLVQDPARGYGIFIEEMLAP